MDTSDSHKDRIAKPFLPQESTHLDTPHESSIPAESIQTIPTAEISAVTTIVPVVSHPPAISQIFSSKMDKGKSPMVEEGPAPKQRTKRQLEQDRLVEEAAKRMHDDQQAELARIHEAKIK